MRDYEYVFCRKLHNKLKELVIGSVWTEVVEDTLKISITTIGDIKFETSIDNFAERFLNGYSSEYAAYEIKSEFRSYLLKRYFK